MNEIERSVRELQGLVNRAIQNASAAEGGRLLNLSKFLETLQEKLQALEELQAAVQELKEKVAELAEPPLQYGVFLGLGPRRTGVGPSDDQGEFWRVLDEVLQAAWQRAANEERGRIRALQGQVQEWQTRLSEERDLVVGIQGQRHEVALSSKDVVPAELKEGQQVVLNKVLNVVGAREQFQRGETAEVVNVIHPTGTARVLERMEGPIREGPPRFRVQWPDGEKTEVDCLDELAAAVRRGDVVQIDADGQRAVAKVKPRLQVRSGGSEGIVAEISQRLFEEGVEIGDIVRVDARLQFAFEKLPSYETGGLALEEVPDVTFADIGGLEMQIEEIRDAIELPYLHRRLFEEYHLNRSKGIFLHGPPGCGKTMIAKAIANSLTQAIKRHLQGLPKLIELYLHVQQHPAGPLPTASGDGLAERYLEGLAELTPPQRLSRLREELVLNDVDLADVEGALARIRERKDAVQSFFLNVKGPELLNKYVGETEHRIRKVFEEAKRRATFHTPVVIFFDEMESMFRTRGSGRSSDVETTIVPQFLAEMDGVEASENVIVVGASNRQDLIDPAIMRPGRLDLKIEIERPKREASLRILSLYLTPDLPLRDDGLPPSGSRGVPRVTFAPKVVLHTAREVAPELARQEGREETSLEELLAELEAVLPERSDARQIKFAEEQRASAKHPALPGLLQELVRREWLAESLIIEVVSLLYNPSSRLDTITAGGKRFTFPLSDFVSGAIWASVVSRAKKKAVKRKIAPPPETAAEDAPAGTTPTKASATPTAPVPPMKRRESGIGFSDLREALNEEFTENSKSFAANRLERELAAKYPGSPPDAVALCEVHWGGEEPDRWTIPKAQPYLKRVVR